MSPNQLGNVRTLPEPVPCGGHGFPLLQALIYSGTPVTGPGTYRIRSWGRKYYVWDAAAYEYDGGIALIGDDDA